MSSCSSCTSPGGWINGWRAEIFSRASERFAKAAEKQAAKGHERVAEHLAARALRAEDRALALGSSTSLPPVLGINESAAAREDAVEFFMNAANFFMEFAQKQADKGHVRVAEHFAEFATRAAAFAASLMEQTEESLPRVQETEAAPQAADLSREAAPAPSGSSSSVVVNIYGTGNFVNITA